MLSRVDIQGLGSDNPVSTVIQDLTELTLVLEGLDQI